MSDHDIAIAHEHYPERGGGEIVADELATVFDAPIITGWIKDRNLSNHDPIEILERTPARHLRRLMDHPIFRDGFYMFAWELVPTLREYDTIIQSGNAPSWYVPEDDQTIIKYVHSPPRHPFDLFGKTKTAGFGSLVNPRYISERLHKKAARQFYKNRMTSVDLFACNSEVVAKRTQKYFGIDDERIRVVYPPVDVHKYTPTPGHDDYYLALSRLHPEKRIDKIIEAFHELNGPDRTLYLKVAGDGPDRRKLERLAGDADYIDILGWVEEEEKVRLMERAKASIFAACNEDFGIVPIESMAAGTPVLGVDAGFTRHQIHDGQNGRLFGIGGWEDSDHTYHPDSLPATISCFENSGVEWSAERIHEFSRQFAVDRFHEEMREVVKEAQKSAEFDTKIKVPKDVPAINE